MDEYPNPNRSKISCAFAVVVAGCLAMGIGASSLAQGGATMIDIAKMTLGGPPTDFEFARTGQGTGGQWIVVADPNGHEVY
jgi:hypothetical protein